MVRIFGIGVAALLLVLAGGGLWIRSYMTSLETEQITDDVWVIFGPGGNAVVLRTAAGPVIVDTMSFQATGARIRERAEELAGGTVQAVINTHYHFDHTHGNPGFEAGTRVVSTERTREYMLRFDAGSWEGEAAELLPNDTFGDAHELRIGGKTIRLQHLGRGHTDGDLVALFVEDRVVHLGDLLFVDFYPAVDLLGGGTAKGWPATLDRAMQLGFDTVVPGHGAVTDRSGIRAFQAFLRELWAIGEEAARSGRSREETIERAQLTTDAGYGVIEVPLLFRLDKDYAVGVVWDEATGAPAGPTGD